MNQATKGNKVKLSTFKSWEKEDILGFKTEEIDGTTYVVFIWCKVCAENSESILNNPKCKGEAKNSIKVFIYGTNGVTKHGVDRHLKGKIHELALSLEKEKPADKRLNINLGQEEPSPRFKIEPATVSRIETSALESHYKLLRTAYELAMTPSMPLSSFSTLVKCQRVNGVRLIQGKQDGKAAREFISCIANAIREKVATVLAGSDFISILSDGSYAAKELILTRVERAGLPCYFITSLVDMGNFVGETDADSIKRSIDYVYKEEMNLPSHVYYNHMVGATSDGDSISTGKYREVLTQLKRERPWLTTINCVNHRVELALKDVMNATFFNEAEKLYKDTYNLLKKSETLKSEVIQAAKVIGITHYKLSKIHGTRFVSRRDKEYKRFLHMLPAFITSFENYKAKSPKTKAKISGLLKKFHNSTQILNMCAALDIFGKLRPATLVFEGEGLMAFEISPTIEMAINDLQDMIDNNEATETDSMLRFFQFDTRDNDSIVAKREYCKAGHEQRKPHEREYHMVEIGNITDFHYRSVECVGEELKLIAQDLIDVLGTRFEELLNGDIYCSMKWLDPQFWEPTTDYGRTQFISLYSLFKEPLDEAGYDSSKVEKEWKQARSFITAHYLKSDTQLTAAMIWKNVLRFRRSEFPNLCKLVSLILTLSGSNSTVERAFSMLTSILSDRRLSKHKVINDIMMIRGNDKIWSIEEKAELMEKALANYHAKRRVKKEAVEPLSKRLHLDNSDESESSDEEDDQTSSSSEEYDNDA